MKRIALPLTLLAVTLIGCDSQGPEDLDEPATWQLIRDEILTPQCAGCHAEGTTFAAQSGLVLTPDAAYGALVGAAPANEAARADRLVRVSDEGLAGLEKSFLWEKINAPEQAHLRDDHPGYGALMPLGGEALTYGELELVRRWIAAGAPETGVVAEALTLLADTLRYEPPETFEPLPLPARGLAFRLGPFDVAPNFERELFYFEPSQSDEDLYVTRIEASMRPGSHHFLLYLLDPGIPDILRPAPQTYRDIRTSTNPLDFSVLQTMQYHRFFGGTQWPFMDYTFPPGVALRLPAGRGIDLNAHYVNRTDEVRRGEIHANLHTVDRTEVEHVAEMLFLNNDAIQLPPGQTTTLAKTFTADETRRIFMLFSHAHRHMTEFRVYRAGGARDGELVYVTTDWTHPPILTYDPPITLSPGEGLRLETTYHNDTGRMLRFGLLSEDEMMILFGYYY